MNRVQLPSRTYMGIQMAIDRLRRAIDAAGGALTFLNNGVLIGERSRVDFRDGFEVVDNDPTAEVNYPAQMTTVERTAWVTPRTGTVVFDTTQSRHFGYNGVVWAEV